MGKLVTITVFGGPDTQNKLKQQNNNKTTTKDSNNKGKTQPQHKNNRNKQASTTIATKTPPQHPKPPKRQQKFPTWGKKGHLIGSPEATRRAVEVPVSPLGWGMVPATVIRIWYLCINHSVRNRPKGIILCDLTGFESSQFRRFPAKNSHQIYF